MAMNFFRLASPLAALLLIASASCVRVDDEAPYGQGILWQVERDGTAPSYVFGTMHSSDPRALALAGEVEGVLREARVTIFESLPGGDDWTAAMASFRLAGLLPDGQRLERLIGPELFEKAASAAGQHGFDRNDVQRLRPWAVAMLLLPPSTAQTGEGLPHFLDLALMSLAESESKPLYGLEDIGDYFRLYGDIPLDVEIASCKTSLKRGRARTEIEPQTPIDLFVSI